MSRQKHRVPSGCTLVHLTTRWPCRSFQLLHISLNPLNSRRTWDFPSSTTPVKSITCDVFPPVFAYLYFVTISGLLLAKETSNPKLVLRSSLPLSFPRSFHRQPSCISIQFGCWNIDGKLKSAKYMCTSLGQITWHTLMTLNKCCLLMLTSTSFIKLPRALYIDLEVADEWGWTAELSDLGRWASLQNPR